MKWMINRSGSVITGVMRLNQRIAGAFEINAQSVRNTLNRPHM
jgi:hypothetical protein